MRPITYSPAYTLVPTYECFNRCSYCNFRADPGQDEWLSLSQAEQILERLQSQNVIEMLILSGEVHPKNSRRTAWFDRIFDLCELALSRGFLPHTNAGILSFDEMSKLKTVNVSMGLMLEQLTPTLLDSVHRNAPSKLPDVRLQQLVWAGELQIPFTTGLLLGIGENQRDRLATLEAIAQVHAQYNHIQEVILQPYSPGQRESLVQAAFQPRQLIELIKIARSILPESIVIQIPPNLVHDDLIACLDAGAQDLGGISPHDEVNPDYPHPQVEELRARVEPYGYQIVPRLPIYPQFDHWLCDRLKDTVHCYRTAGLATSKNSVTQRR